MDSGTLRRGWVFSPARFCCWAGVLAPLSCRTPPRVPATRDIVAAAQPDGTVILSGLCFDGAALVVELLAGAEYRTYTYSSCGDGFEPAGKALHTVISRHLMSAVANPRTRSAHR